MSPRAIALGLALAALACSARAELDRRIAETWRTLREAEAHGAMQCAPRELAVARSHLEFAQLERGHGFAARAREHLDVADENVHAARQLSQPLHCPSAEPRPPRAEVTADAGTVLER